MTIAAVIGVVLFVLAGVWDISIGAVSRGLALIGAAVLVYGIWLA